MKRQNSGEKHKNKSTLLLAIGFLHLGFQIGGFGLGIALDRFSRAGLNPFHIIARAGVYFYRVTLINEERNLDNVTGF